LAVQNEENSVKSSIGDKSSHHKVSDKTSHAEPKIPGRQLSLHELLQTPVMAQNRSLREGSAALLAVDQQPKRSRFAPRNVYGTLPNGDAASINDLPLATIIRVAKDAANTRRSDVMDHIARDVVENFQGSEQLRSQIVSSLVTFAAKKYLLPYTRILSLLQVLEASGCLTDLPELTAMELANIIFTNFSSLPTSDSTLSVLLALLDKSLRLSTSAAKGAAKGAATINYQPPLIVEFSYYLIQKLLRIRRDHQALEFFQVLAKYNNIPPEAVSEINDGSTDSSFIILSTLVRSSLHWGWRRAAVQLCKNMLRANTSPSVSDINLTVDVLYALLEAPTPTDLDQFSYLIRDLGVRAVDFQLPHGLIRLFYEAAYKFNAGSAAEVLYEHTQSAKVLSRHQYPCPGGHALTWLLNRLALNSKNLHLGRLLTRYVVDNYEPIPLQDRARFIATAASSGYGLEARALWQRYSVGRDRQTVVGNAASMVRMVSLFVDVIHKNQSRLEEVIERQQAGEGGEAIETERELYEVRGKDSTSFLHFVVSEFRLAKEPLAQAGHFDLTSLARAYFMLGDISAGFEAFKTLLDRKEMPDLHDINVALSAMAEYTPEGAAKMIERMVRKGVRPDPITFGTVIHFALIHQHTELVHKLINMARLAGNGPLTLESVQALIRASVEMEDSSPSLVLANLERGLMIMQSLAGSDLMCSPNTGKYCTLAALELRDPVLAFKFWKLLVRRKLGWNDTQHVNLRLRIAAQVRKRCRMGLLLENLAKIIHHELMMEAPRR
jgi:hypothetical protein